MKKQNSGSKPFFSPAKNTAMALLATITSAIFFVEMILHNVFGGLPVFWGSFLDAVFLIILLVPLLYIFLFDPMLAEIERRQEAENNLREMNVFNEALLQAMPFGVDVIDEEGRILFLNSAMEEYVGISAIGDHCWLSYKDDRLQCQHCPIKRGVALGETIIVETRGALGGRILQVSHTGMLYGGKKAVLEIFWDITEQRLTLEALKKSESLLAEAQRILHMGSWDWNIANNAISASEETLRIFGLSPEKRPISFETFLKEMHPDDREAVCQAVESAIRNKAGFDIEHRILLPDGSERIVHERGEVRWDENGEVYAMMGSAHDITARKKMENKIMRVQIEKEKLETVKVLSVTFAHHIFNAVAPVKGFAELIMKFPNDSDKMRDYARSIIECADNAVILVNKLKELESAEVKEFGGMKILDIEERRKKRT